MEAKVNYDVNFDMEKEIVAHEIELNSLTNYRSVKNGDIDYKVFKKRESENCVTTKSTTNSEDNSPF